MRLWRPTEHADSTTEYVRSDIAHDANAQLNAMRADRDRYKAWHDDVASRRLHVLQENGRVYDAIVRPKPLKENE